MYSLNKSLFLFVFCLLISACKTQIREKEVDEIRYFIKPDFEASLDFYDTESLFSSNKLIRLETKKESLLGVICKVMLYQERLYIFSENPEKLLAFDLSGKFLFKIGRFGNGPGEFALLSDFSIDKDKNELLILDMKKDRIFRYDMEGNYLGWVGLPFSVVAFEHIQRYYWLHPSKNSDRESGSYWHLWDGENIHDKFFDYVNNRNGNLDQMHKTSVYKSNLTFWEPFNDTIYHINQNAKDASQRKSGTFGYKSYIDFGTEKLDEKVWKMNLANKIDYLGKVKNKCTWVNNVIATEDIIYFTFVSPEGRLTSFYDKQSNHTVVSKKIKLQEGKTIKDLYGIANEEYAYSVIKQEDEIQNIIKLNEEDNPAILLHKMKY